MSWQTTPNGCTGTFYSKRIDVNRMPKVSAMSAALYRVSIEGIESSELKDKGIVRSIQDGRTLAMETLKELKAKEKEKYPPTQESAIYPKSVTLSEERKLEFKIKTLDVAASLVNGALGPLPLFNQDISDITERIGLVLRTYDNLYAHINPSIGPQSEQS